MLLQKQNGKQYLYVQQASKQGFMVVDVTKPEIPALLRRTAEPNQATSGNLDMVAPDVAIAEAPEKTPTDANQQQSSYGNGPSARFERSAQSEDAGNVRQSHKPFAGWRAWFDLSDQRRGALHSALHSSLAF